MLRRSELLSDSMFVTGLNSVDILGVRITCVDIKTMLELVQEWAEQQCYHTISYVNAHCLNIASEDPMYQAILNKADLVYADGISVVWAGRLLGGCRMQKATGADWIDEFCDLAQANNWRIYIIAGKAGMAKMACHNLTKRHPRLNIVGACDGYFMEKSQFRVLRDIEKTAPHILFVGLGTPRQEKWIARHRDRIPVPICWAVGALFDYIAGVEPRAPAWMRALALEWLWRLLLDPSGKWRRYILGNPLFIYRVLRQKWASKK